MAVFTHAQPASRPASLPAVLCPGVQASPVQVCHHLYSYLHLGAADVAASTSDLAGSWQEGVGVCV